MNRSKRDGEGPRQGDCDGDLPGIIIHGRDEEAPPPPRIHAFIWGGEVPSHPVLPYGRWKGAA